MPLPPIMSNPDHRRTHWKIENEGNNVLKNRSYHLEHNFGHGKQQLSTVLLPLNLLAFLFHTILHLVDTMINQLELDIPPAPP